MLLVKRTSVGVHQNVHSNLDVYNMCNYTGICENKGKITTQTSFLNLNLFQCNEHCWIHTLVIMDPLSVFDLCFLGFFFCNFTVIYSGMFH